jgi:LPXTG-motif cell wall-anchored protein
MEEQIGIIVGVIIGIIIIAVAIYYKKKKNLI